MLLALVTSLVLSAGPGDSSSAEPMQAIIIGGGKTAADAERAQRQWESVREKVRVSAQGRFPQVVQSGDVQGLKPGFVVTILGYCRASEAQRVLGQIRSEFAGAYVRDVTGQSAECPVIGDARRVAALAAVQRGDLPAVKRALDEGLDVRAVATDGKYPNTLLSAAVTARQTEVVRLLLERGAHPSSTDLEMAVSRGSAEVVRLLLEKKADPNSTYLGEPVLLSAIRSGRLEIVTALLDGGANPNLTGQAGERGRGAVAPLYFAAACAGEPELLEALGKRGLDLRATTPQGTTMLVHAINDCFWRKSPRGEPLWKEPENPKRLARLNALIAAGVDVNARTDSGTALHEALRFNDVGAAKALLKAGANLTLTDKQGNTPLHEAAMNDNAEIVKLMLEGGAAINALNKRRESALYLAIWAQNYDPDQIVEVLLGAGADVKLVSASGYSAADCACRKGEFEIAKDLIKRGAPFKGGKPTAKKCTWKEGD